MNPTSFDYLVIKESDMKDKIVKDQELNGIYLHKNEFKNWSIDQTEDSPKKIFTGQTTYNLTSIDQRIPGLEELNTYANINPIPVNVKRIGGGPITSSEKSLTKLDLKYNVTEVPPRLLTSLTNLKELHISPKISLKSVGDMFINWSDTNYNDLFDGSGRLKFGDDIVGFRPLDRDKHKLEKIIFKTPNRVNTTKHTIHEEYFEKSYNDNLYIKAAMFERLKGLKTLLLPEMGYVPPRMCRNCDNLKSIDLCDTASHISSRAFEKCSSLKSIVGVSSIEYIGERAFKNCGLLTVNNWYWLRTCSAEAFAYCSNLKFVAFDWSRIAPATLYFGPRVFYNCTDLRAADFTDMYMENADYISEEKLDFDHPAEIIVNIQTSLGDFNKSYDRMFYNCHKLEYVKLGRSCQRIGHEMFSNCFNLVSIQMPTRVNEFCSNAFLNCSNLKEITITITDDTHEIGWGLFRGCHSLEVIRIDLSNIHSYDQFADIERRIKLNNIYDRYPRFRNFSDDDLTNIAVRFYSLRHYLEYLKPFIDHQATWIMDLLAHCEPSSGLINVEVILGYYYYNIENAFVLAAEILNTNSIFSTSDYLGQRYGLFNPRRVHYFMSVH